MTPSDRTGSPIARPSVGIDTRYRRIVAVAAPVALANTIVPLQNLVDTAIVGHFDEAAFLAAVAVAVQLLSIMLVSFNFLQYASSGQAAQAKGGGHTGQLGVILQRALVLSLGIATVLFALKSWLIPLGLRLFSASPQVEQLAQQYLHIRMVGVFAELCNYALLGWFAGMARTRYMLYQQAVVGVVNIAVTLLLVYGADMGLDGVAWGTVAGHNAGLLVALALAARVLGVDVMHLLRVQAEQLSWRSMRALASLNANIFVRTLVFTASFAWVTRLSSQLGEEVLAANSVLMMVLYASAMALDGVAVAAESLSGQAYGSGQRAVFWQVVRRTGVVSLGLALLLYMLWWLGMPLFINGMTDIASVQQVAWAYAPFAIALPLVSVAAFWLDGIFFGMTAGRQIRQAAVLVGAVFFPLSYWLFLRWGNTGIWLGIYALMLLRMVLLLGFLWQQKQTTDQTGSVHGSN